jgi:DNA-binding response OmpR family regulator
MRILLVEDQPGIASFIKRGLREEGYAIDLARDGKEAYFLLDTNEYDAIVLDIILPDIDGLEICRCVRSRGLTIPIMLLTAKDQLEDKISGFDLGADDYLTKPFAFEEFLARLRALLRRGQAKYSSKLKVADLELDQIRHTLKRSGKLIPLTLKEYALIEYLMLNADNIVTRTMIAEHVWDQHFDNFTNVIDVYINHLRNKINHGFKKQLIETVRGVGYILKSE